MPPRSHFLIICQQRRNGASHITNFLILFPHVAAYSPTTATFAEYDWLVFYYADAKSLLGTEHYQMKEGRPYPQKPATREGSFWVRGRAAQSSSVGKGWTVVSESELIAFLQFSGEDWHVGRNGC